MAKIKNFRTGLKGSVAIKVSNDRLQLVYRWRGRRFYLSLGLPDSSNNRKYAQSVASAIELDILTGNYDTTQAKYKFESDATSKKLVKILLLTELWDKYVDYKRPQVSPNTIANTYRQVERWLVRMPYTALSRHMQYSKDRQINFYNEAIFG